MTELSNKKALTNVRTAGLKDEANKLLFGLLEQAEKSDNPEIVKCVLKMATKNAAHQRSQSRKLHPFVAAILAIVVAAGAMWLCIYASKQDSTAAAVWVSVAAFILAIALILLFARLSGALSETEFTKLFSILPSWMRSMLPKLPGNSVDQITASDEDGSSE